MLNKRELEILKLASAGMSNKDIARKLDITEHTVGSHLVNIFRKLGVESRTQAALRAMQLGWVDIDTIGEQLSHPSKH